MRSVTSPPEVTEIGVSPAERVVPESIVRPARAAADLAPT